MGIYYDIIDYCLKLRQKLINNEIEHMIHDTYQFRMKLNI